MKAEPYLFFDGRCEEALEFYRKALGAQIVMMMRFKESPDPGHNVGPGTGEKIMHATFRVGDAAIMASDGDCKGRQKFEGFALSLAPSTIPEAERLFANLAEGGQVQMPLTQTFWSPRFGMLADKFGVSWMINVTPAT